MRHKPKFARKSKTHYSVFTIHFVALLGCLMLISVYLLSGVYSKFYTSAFDSDHARAAQFSPAFHSTEIVASDQLPGYFAEIPFAVQNFSGDSPAEVAMKYKIILKTTGNIPLTFTLLDHEKHQLGSPWSCNGTSGEQTYEYADNSLVFGAATKETDNYYLKIEWPSGNKDVKFSGMTDAVYLSIEFEQID